MTSQIRFPSELKEGEIYILKKYSGEVVDLGKFKGNEINRERHLLSYGSNTRLPNKLNFEKGHVMDSMVFPPRLGGSGIFTVSKGGRKRKKIIRSRKKSTHKNSRKHRKQKTKHNRGRKKHKRTGRR